MLGILALIAGLVPVAGLVLGILAIISSRRAGGALAQAPGTYEPGGLHTAGFITGTIGLAMSALVTLWLLMVMSVISAAIAAAASAPASSQMVEQPLLW